MKSSSSVVPTFPAGTRGAAHSARPYGPAGAGLVSAWEVWTWFFILAAVILGITGFIDPNYKPLSYGFTALMIAGICMSLAHFGILNDNIRYLWPALILSAIGIISFVLSRISGELMSYGAALVPIGFSAAACFLPSGRVNVQWALRRFSRALFVLIGPSLVLSLVGARPVNHQSMMIVIIALAIASVTRQKTLMTAAIVTVVVYSLLRPSSTIVVATITVIAFALLHRAKFMRAYYAGIFGGIFAIVAINLMTMINPDVLLPILEVETVLKTEVLGGRTNSAFRLSVIRAASHEYGQGSFLFGKFFSGSINAPEMEYYLPWWNDDEAPIHSDFAIIIQQGGLFGITLFAGWFLGILRMFRNGARLAAVVGAPEAKRFLEAATLCCLVVAIFLSFNPVLQQLGAMMTLYAIVWLGAMARIALASEAEGFVERPSGH